MPNDPSRYSQHRARAADYSRRLATAGRDIGAIPPVADPRRRAATATDFSRFCREYFPLLFTLDWSIDHPRVLAKIEAAVLRGGQFALAMPRGSGKTTIAETAAIFAILHGHRRFVVLIGSDEGAAAQNLDSIKVELATNPQLLADFPEAVHPIHALDGISQRAKGQTFRGRRTSIGWTNHAVMLPTIPGSRASGAIIRVAGLTGRLRGLKHKTADGDAIRPDLVILDDPQTDESARSPSQCDTRERVIAGAVLGLAGPGKKISAVCPCTVIRAGDLADRLLDRERHPEWQGERTKTVYQWPSDETKWARYAKLRAESLRADGDGSEATDYYRRHRKAMDAGAKVAWPARFNADELSAVQNAMNLRIDNEEAFAAEYQNEPIMEKPGDLDLPTAREIAARTSGRPRRQIPADCEILTVFIDVHDRLLYWAVCAWRLDFAGQVIDYGTYPKQTAPYFTLRQATATLGRRFPGRPKTGAILAGLEALTEELLGREWPREDGVPLRVRRCLIDAGYEAETIYLFCRRSPHAAVLMPSHGQGVTAGRKPISQYERRRGQRLGHYWWIPKPGQNRAARHIRIDTNYWKTHVHNALRLPIDAPGALTLFGRRPAAHRLIADHLLAEAPTLTHGHGRQVYEWRQLAARDNHFLDCLVGCAAAASLAGAKTLPDAPAPAAPKKRPRRRVSYL